MEKKTLMANGNPTVLPIVGEAIEELGGKDNVNP